ncbi:hypothetical protein BDV95DRAFT_177784 [Massariosphaeria phaeospora]|uniref:Uncharacterized protein n=1 Tax=Massariosphaeria phaeospora TaxID=100035 RepID=A0A7C8M371_9PLEO|nr:hypothetical protein BDV95DRAFT_177784 [Massariosphaeria phaeospora]
MHALCVALGRGPWKRRGGEGRGGSRSVELSIRRSSGHYTPCFSPFIALCLYISPSLTPPHALSLSLTHAHTHKNTPTQSKDVSIKAPALRGSPSFLAYPPVQLRHAHRTYILVQQSVPRQSQSPIPKSQSQCQAMA